MPLWAHWWCCVGITQLQIECASTKPHSHTHMAIYRVQIYLGRFSRIILRIEETNKIDRCTRAAESCNFLFWDTIFQLIKTAIAKIGRAIHRCDSLVLMSAMAKLLVSILALPSKQKATAKSEYEVSGSLSLARAHHGPISIQTQIYCDWVDFVWIKFYILRCACVCGRTYLLLSYEYRIRDWPIHIRIMMAKLEMKLKIISL